MTLNGFNPEQEYAEPEWAYLPDEQPNDWDDDEPVGCACSRCTYVNSVHARRCSNCGEPLTCAMKYNKYKIPLNPGPPTAEEWARMGGWEEHLQQSAV